MVSLLTTRLRNAVNGCDTAPQVYAALRCRGYLSLRGLRHRSDVENTIQQCIDSANARPMQLGFDPAMEIDSALNGAEYLSLWAQTWGEMTVRRGSLWRRWWA
jgi:hypothetical protein